MGGWVGAVDVPSLFLFTLSIQMVSEEEEALRGRMAKRVGFWASNRKREAARGWVMRSLWVGRWVGGWLDE